VVYLLVCFPSLHARLRVRSGIRLSLRPLSCRGSRRCRTRLNLPRECGSVSRGRCHCEERSDEAIQCAEKILDCFASLAMTAQLFDMMNRKLVPVLAAAIVILRERLFVIFGKRSAGHAAGHKPQAAASLSHRGPAS